MEAPIKLPQFIPETAQVYKWKFSYRVYKKNRSIWIKPFHDKVNHFSIIISKGKKLSAEEFDAIEKLIREYIVSRKNTLTFTIIRACANCTYGRFDREFEELILGSRKKYPGITREKDLTINDPKHAGLSDHVLWNEDYPIIHHIHGKGQSGEDELSVELSELEKSWREIFAGITHDKTPGAKYGNTVVMEISFE